MEGAFNPRFVIREMYHLYHSSILLMVLMNRDYEDWEDFNLVDGIEEFKNKVLSEIPIIKEQDTRRLLSIFNPIL